MDHDIPEDVSDNINGVLLPTNHWVRVILYKRACLPVKVLTNLIDEGRSAENRSNDLQLSYTFNWEETAEGLVEADAKDRNDTYPLPLMTRRTRCK